jgi:hypothetical protein
MLLRLVVYDISTSQYESFRRLESSMGTVHPETMAEYTPVLFIQADCRVLKISMFQPWSGITVGEYMCST